MDHFTVVFGVNKLRDLLQFPQADPRPEMDGYEAFGSFSKVLAFIRYLGYKGELPKMSMFN